MQGCSHEAIGRAGGARKGGVTQGSESCWAAAPVTICGQASGSMATKTERAPAAKVLLLATLPGTPLEVGGEKRSLLAFQSLLIVSYKT